MEVYYITRNSAGVIDKDFLYNYLADKIVSSLDELDDDETTWLFVKIYPSSVITTPEPVALAVPSDIP